MMAPFFILAMAAALIIFSVDGLSAVCSDTTSRLLHQILERHELTSTSRAAAGVT